MWLDLSAVILLCGHSSLRPPLLLQRLYVGHAHVSRHGAARARRFSCLSCMFGIALSFVSSSQAIGSLTL